MKVAVVGAGYFGQFHIDAWPRIDGATLVGVAERDPARAAALSAPTFADAVEMAQTAHPDIIDIAAPPVAHAELIAALAPLCPNLICQKPFCRDLKEAEATAAAAKAAGARVIIHENIRNQPWYAEALRLAEAGALGAVRQVSFRLRPGDGRGPSAYLDRQPYFQQMERFLIHETAIHWLDLFRAFLGEPDGVYADLRRLNAAIQGEDSGLVILDYADGRRAVFDGDRLGDHAAENRRRTMGDLLVEGTEATLSIDGEGRIWLRDFGAPTPRQHPFAWDDIDFGGDCVRLSCAQYLSAFQTGREHPTEAARYLANIRLEEATYASAAAGRRLAISA